MRTSAELKYRRLLELLKNRDKTLYDLVNDIEQALLGKRLTNRQYSFEMKPVEDVIPLLVSYLEKDMGYCVTLTDISGAPGHNENFRIDVSIRL